MHVCAAGASGRQQRGEAGGPQRLYSPELKWALDLEPGGFDSPFFEDSGADSSGAKKSRAGGSAGSGVREFHAMYLPPKGKPFQFAFLRIRMEPALAPGDAEALRASALASHPRTKRVKGDFKQSEYKQTPLLGFSLRVDVPGWGGSTGPRIPNSVQALEAFFVRAGTWITFSYTAEKIGENEEKLFYELLDSVKFVDATSPSNSYDYFMLGGELSKRKRHGEAIAALGKALELEQKQRTLPQQQWRHLLMNLANALGATDQVERAKEVLEYGAATDATYPYFHHGLARLHSHFGDLERVLAELEKAYQYQPDGSKGYAGRPIPDPMSDPAFQRYRDDPKFRDAVKALKKKFKD